MKFCTLAGIALAMLMSFSVARADDEGLWLTTGEWSAHDDEGKHHYRQNNTGVGLEYRYSPNSAVMLGTYRNSFDKDAAYLGLSWLPLHPAPGVGLGVTNVLVTGYTRNGRVLYVPLPTASYDYKGVGLNVFWVPTIVVAVQLKVKVW